MAVAAFDPDTFAQLVDESADAMFMFRPGSDVLTYCNAALVALLGYNEAGELIGRPALETFIHPSDRAIVLAATIARRDGGSRMPVNARWRRHDGSPLMMQATASFLEYQGEPAILITARRDTELKAMRLAAERSRVLFDLTPVPVWVFDRVTLEYLAVNQAIIDLYGYSRDELLKMRVPDVKFDEDVPGMVAGISSIVVGNLRQVGVRRHKTKDGRVVDIDISSHLIEFDGRTAVMAIGLDVTEANKLEAQLRQAQKMEAVGQLAGGVAHDFNNLLCVVLANVELAIEGADEGADISEELREIEVAAERATALTRQLLAFSRKQPRRTTTISVAVVVTTCEKMLSRIVGEDIEMSLVLAPDLAAIHADASQLEQVLVNLVINARDAMPNGGLVIVETANIELGERRASALGLTAGSYVELSVHDTGTGMDAATKARVFEPFFTTKGVGKGTGLGLSTVFGIVSQSSGSIVVESELGTGTVFRVFLPAVADRPEATSELPMIEPARGDETVLLVEDDPRLRSVIHRHLVALGYTTHDAPQAHAALELLRRDDIEFDLLLTDLVMPGLDGRALATEALLLRPRLRVVFMSGFTEHAAVKTARFEHDHFVEKPFTSAKLSHAIRRALL
jgi:two-component system, cell cycle sensor histidine kinase and response regulator CckA